MSFRMLTADARAEPPRLFVPAPLKVTYGPTLARQMSTEDVRTYLEGQDADKLIGAVHVLVCRSHLPDTINIEHMVDGIAPAIELLALQVADQRIRHLNSIATGKLNITAIEAFSADVIRAKAVDLVSAIRSRPPAPVDLMPKQFDLSFEDAVTAAMVALVTAPITPRSLAGGG